MPNLGLHLCGHFMQNICQESLYRSGLCSSQKRRQKSGKIQQFVRITILCPWALRSMALTVLKASSWSADRQKNQNATGEKLSTFFLFQSIPMAIHQGTAVCVMGYPKNTSTGLYGLFNFQVHEAEEL